MRKKVIIGISIAIIAVLLVVVAVLGMMTRGGQPTSQISKDNPAAALFYDSLGNAAGQQQLRVAMYRATYPSSEDADAKQNTGSELSSVAEVDVATNKSRSVYATSAPNPAKPTAFTTGRCMDGTTYDDDYTINKVPRPASLAEAAEDLKTNQHLYKSSVPLFIPCPNVGPITGAAIDLAAFRLSDGVFPVTLTGPQASNWKNKVKQADLFTVKDEGMVERSGRQLKKIGFTPKNQDGVNKQLYSIFYETAEIDKIKAEQPNAIYDYEFITLQPANTGSVGGYYLIDEKSKLPVYSELYGTNTKSTSRFNVARTKQTYEFGKPLALTVDSQLEILQ